MSGSLSGAIKAHLETLGLGVAIYRDGAPVNAERPYVTVQEGIALAPERHGDFASADAHQGDTEQVQVDLWQNAREMRSPGRTANAESYDLPGELRRALTGTLGGRTYGTPPRRIYGARVIAGQRWPISDNIVRHTLTVEVRRDA